MFPHSKQRLPYPTRKGFLSLQEELEIVLHLEGSIHRAPCCLLETYRRAARGRGERLARRRGGDPAAGSHGRGGRRQSGFREPRAGQADSDLPTFPARKESRTPAGGQGPRLPVVLGSNQTFP